MARLPLIPKPPYSTKFRLLQVLVDHGNALTGVFACLDGSSARRRRTLFVNNVSPVPPTDSQTANPALADPSAPRFADLGLAEPLLRALAAAHYTTPTPLQAQAIPDLLQGQIGRAHV